MKKLLLVLAGLFTAVVIGPIWTIAALLAALVATLRKKS